MPVGPCDAARERSGASMGGALVRERDMSLRRMGRRTDAPGVCARAWWLDKQLWPRGREEKLVSWQPVRMRQPEMAYGEVRHGGGDRQFGPAQGERPA